MPLSRRNFIRTVAQFFAAFLIFITTPPGKGKSMPVFAPDKKGTPGKKRTRPRAEARLLSNRVPPMIRTLFLLRSPAPLAP